MRPSIETLRRFLVTKIDGFAMEALEDGEIGQCIPLLAFVFAPACLDCGLAYYEGGRRHAQALEFVGDDFFPTQTRRFIGTLREQVLSASTSQVKRYTAWAQGALHFHHS